MENNVFFKKARNRYPPAVIFFFSQIMKISWHFAAYQTGLSALTVTVPNNRAQRQGGQPKNEVCWNLVEPFADYIGKLPKKRTMLAQIFLKSVETFKSYDHLKVKGSSSLLHWILVSRVAELHRLLVPSPSRTVTHAVWRVVHVPLIYSTHLKNSSHWWQLVCIEFAIANKYDNWPQ